VLVERANQQAGSSICTYTWQHLLIRTRDNLWTGSMAEPHVISALTAKRAELSGELSKFNERSTAIRAHIANIDAVLRLFC
jgi:hypothetical protein